MEWRNRGIFCANPFESNQMRKKSKGRRNSDPIPIPLQSQFSFQFNKTINNNERARTKKRKMKNWIENHLEMILHVNYCQIKLKQWKNNKICFINSSLKSKSEKKNKNKNTRPRHGILFNNIDRIDGVCILKSFEIWLLIILCGDRCVSDVNVVDKLTGWLELEKNK